jgi:putative toxin-antitoxin system, antitoxin component
LDDLVQYRLSSAKERLESARLLLDAGQYKDSIGRSYYAIFTAVRAVLARDQVDFSKHAGVIAYFQREYIKSAIFDIKYSKILQRAFQIRNNCDYDDFFIVSKEDATEQYKNAVDMVQAIETYIKQ